MAYTPNKLRSLYAIADMLSTRPVLDVGRGTQTDPAGWLSERKVLDMSHQTPFLLMVGGLQTTFTVFWCSILVDAAMPLFGMPL